MWLFMNPLKALFEETFANFVIPGFGQETCDQQQRSAAD